MSSLKDKSPKQCHTDGRKMVDEIHESCLAEISDELDIANYFLDNGTINMVQYKGLNPLILSIINHPDIKEYYNSNLVSYNEREIIQKNDKNLRPDRIVFNKDNKAIIIDYKTGNPNSYHKKQLDEYENALKKMVYSTLKKFLVYIETDVVNVTI